MSNKKERSSGEIKGAKAVLASRGRVSKSVSKSQSSSAGKSVSKKGLSEKLNNKINGKKVREIEGSIDTQLPKSASIKVGRVKASGKINSKVNTLKEEGSVGRAKVKETESLLGKSETRLGRKRTSKVSVVSEEIEVEIDNRPSDELIDVNEIDELLDDDVISEALSADIFTSSFDGFDGGRAERLTKATGVDAQTAFHMKNTELFRRRDEIKLELDEISKVEDERKGRLPSALRDRRRRLNLDLDTVTWDIFEFNKGLVRSYVKKFTSNTSLEDSEDFMSAGSVGLMRAIDSFKVDQGRFGHWAYKPIQREVLRAVRDADYENMNPGDFEKRPDILRAQKELVLESGKEDFQPSLEAVAVRAGVTLKQADRVLNAPKLDSLHAPVGEDGDTTVGDLIVSGAPDLSDSVVSKLEVEALEAFGLSCLDRRELFVLARRFGLDCEPEQRLSAIGDMLGLSREAVRQVESKALAKLMHPTTLRKIARAGRA